MSGVSTNNAGLTNCHSKSDSLAERTVLNGGGEERVGIDFFPKIESRGTPGACDVIKIVLDEGPESVGDIGDIALRDKLVG